MCSERLAESFIRGKEIIRRIRGKIHILYYLILKLLRRKREKRDNLF